MVALTQLTRILLVHGAAADGSSWSSVIPHLLDAGFPVTAVQLPLSSTQNDISVVQDGIKTLNQNSSDPILVVAHSFGGLAITTAAQGAANVEGLVYVQAFAPDANETVGALVEQYPASYNGYVKTADGRAVLPQKDFITSFAPDVPVSQSRVLATVQGPFDLARFGYVTASPAWRSIKNLYFIIGSEDQIINPDLEAFYAKRMGAKTTTIKASHAGLISHAAEVAGVILEAASAVEKSSKC